MRKQKNVCANGANNQRWRGQVQYRRVHVGREQIHNHIVHCRRQRTVSLVLDDRVAQIERNAEPWGSIMTGGAKAGAWTDPLIVLVGGNEWCANTKKAMRRRSWDSYARSKRRTISLDVFSPSLNVAVLCRSSKPLEGGAS